LGILFLEELNLRVLYSFQAIPAPSSWSFVLILFLGLAVYLACYRKIKAYNPECQVRAYNSIVLVLVLITVLVYFTKRNQAAEYADMKLKYRTNEYMTVVGELSGLKYSKGFDEFFISQQRFIRYLPDRQVPQYGCWREYMTDHKILQGKRVKLDYVVFPEYVSTPSQMGGKKIDQMCILRFEILEN